MLGDTAYGSGPVRAELAEREVELLAPVPAGTPMEGRLARRDFQIDTEAGTVSCPAGQTAPICTEPSGKRSASFAEAICDRCPLRALRRPGPRDLPGADHHAPSRAADRRPPGARGPCDRRTPAPHPTTDRAAAQPARVASSATIGQGADRRPGNGLTVLGLRRVMGIRRGSPSSARRVRRPGVRHLPRPSLRAPGPGWPLRVVVAWGECLLHPACGAGISARAAKHPTATASCRTRRSLVSDPEYRRPKPSGWAVGGVVFAASILTLIGAFQTSPGWPGSSATTSTSSRATTPSISTRPRGDGSTCSSASCSS